MGKLTNKRRRSMSKCLPLIDGARKVGFSPADYWLHNCNAELSFFSVSITE